MKEYILLIGIVFLISFNLRMLVRGTNNNLRKIINKVSFLINFFVLSFFSGFRYYVGTDYSNYVTMFNNTQTRSEIVKDYMFFLLNKVLYFITDNYIIFFIVTSLIITYFFLKAIYENSFYIEISVIIFICFGFYLTSFNIVRQYMAISIMFFSYKYIIKRDYLKYFSINILCLLIHGSAIIMLPMYWILNMEYTIKNTKRIMTITIIIFLFYNNILNLVFKILPVYSNYQGSFFINNGASPMFFIITLAILILVLRYRNYILKLNKGNKVYINALIVGVVLAFISIRGNIFLRLSDYFRVSIILLIPYIIKILPKKLKIFGYSIAMVFFIVLFISLLKLNHGNIIPYKSIL